MITPNIHLFRTREAGYLYDVNRNTILRIKKSVYDIINNIMINNIAMNEIIESQKEEYNDIVDLINKGFLSSNKPTKIRHPMDETLVYSLSNKLWLMILQVTQQCNLRCKYCVYSGNYENRSHSSKRMSFETAKKCIDFLIKHSKDNSGIAIGFYGGEPLTEFNLIRTCIEYTEKQAEGKKILFTITTNATLLNDDIVKYFIEHKVSLVVSLDGPSEIHNKNRRYAVDNSGTFDKIMENLKNLKNKFPDYFRMVSFNTVLDYQSDFGCINDFFMNYETINESFLRVTSICDAYSKKPIQSSIDFSTKANYEYFKLLISKIGRLDDKFVSKLVKEYYSDIRSMYERLKPTDNLPETMHSSGPCIPGVTRLFINTDGNMYPCEKVSEESSAMCIGNIDRGFDIPKIRKLLNIGQLTETKCMNCWALRFCNICAKTSDEFTELSAQKRISECSKVHNSIEGKMKDICTLQEFGTFIGNDLIEFVI